MGRTFGETITQPAKSLHTATVIALHGLGDDCHGWEHLGKQLALDHVKFIYPTGATRPITINGGQMMTAWFDMDSLENASKMIAGELDDEGINESVEYVKGLIDKEIAAGIDLSRIVVFGFSQGGHIALKTMLSANGALGGCVALSTILTPIKTEVGAANKATPVFIGHGEVDPLLPLQLGKAIAPILKSVGFEEVEFKSYSGVAHSSCPQELEDIRSFLRRTIPVSSTPKPTMEEVSTMSIKQLKTFLTQAGVDTSTCLEKSDLIEKAKNAL